MDGEDKFSPDGVEVARFARATRRGRPPAKAYMSKPFSARAGKAATPLRKGPIIPWQRHAGFASAAEATVTNQGSNGREAKGENMSERFIAERLTSDRASSTFNPQVPRRVPDIPNLGTLKGSEADMEGKRLLVGKAVSLCGEIGGCERLVIEGKVDVTLNDVKTLEVGAQGVFKGTAAVEAAIIAGTFEGTLKVSGHLEVGPGAVVKGTVSYGTIAVASGGKLLGTIASLEAPAT
jgi:cytoskeletal protein CcmA (bactofilin family)